jgi:DNA-binding transcriptional regulator LsrR (DeoR family)
MFEKVNISINGIGSFYPEEISILSRPDFMSAEDLEKLHKANVYGDIALRFIDKDGNECQTDLAKRMLAIDLEQFKKIRTKITIASGLEKKQPLLSALKGKLIDVLIIDNQLAMSLLEE